ncbi:MAG: di-trans,poly-cis-decaprenylcistransferase [Longimicrobiales bacterium]|nr:di-trans,poly-cis-decaprenylcistransferase [Longimicrobiales bacterium]
MSRVGAGLHVAIIMDGNGRWARSRGLSRTRGHREGAAAVRRVVEAAPALGIGTLTLYAFSADNWKRPRPEVNALMRLLHRYLRTETAELVEQGVRVTLLGRRDRLPSRVLRAAETAESATADGNALDLRLAIDYSARDALVRAAELLRGSGDPICPDRFSEALGAAMHASGGVRDVDLLIRTSGEERLSDFLLWECAYAEFVFTPTLWPDFGGDDLRRAVETFHGRDRRYGGLSEAETRAAAG